MILRKPKDQKKPSRKNLIKKADTAFATYIRSKSPVCYFSGYIHQENRDTEHCFHWVSRRYYATRWDELNATHSCSGCNLEMNYHPHKFIEVLIRREGVNRYLDLCERSKRQEKLYADDLVRIADEFTEKMAKNGLI